MPVSSSCGRFAPVLSDPLPVAWSNSTVKVSLSVISPVPVSPRPVSYPVNRVVASSARDAPNVSGGSIRASLATSTVTSCGVVVSAVNVTWSVVLS